MPENTPPRFISYDEFLDKYDEILAMFPPQEREFMEQQSQNPNDPDQMKRVIYAVVSAMFQNPGIPYHDLLYAINYRIALDALALGYTPEQARDTISAVRWDEMPGMSGYTQETANSIASHAFRDAVEGKIRGPIQSRVTQGPDLTSFTIDTGRMG